MSKERAYQTSHPWINFKLDLGGNTSYLLWLLLGAVESKCKHLAGIPLRPEKQQEINIISLRKGVHATTAIEGNSFSEDEVQRVIDNSQAGFSKSQEYQRKEVENVVKAYNNIVQEVDENGTCSADFCELMRDNLTIMDGLDLKQEVIPGRIRTHSVVVGKYRGAPAEDCEYLLDRFFKWIEEDWGMGNEHRVIEGILKAVIAHLYIAWIHPFGDGNGRSARMLEFRLLMSASVPLNAAHLLTSHYNDTRDEYYSALAAASRGPNGNAAQFLHYALQGFKDALDKQIDVILAEQLNVTWKNYIHESAFKGPLTKAQTRERNLLLELSTFDGFIPLNELRRRLPGDVLAMYDGKTGRAFNRDINDLERRGLIIKKERSVSAAKQKMKAFLPICRKDGL